MIDRPSDMRGRHVLVVDDEQSVRHVLRRYLDRRGWCVAEANTAGAAMLLVEDPANEIDAVIVDLHLPDLSGSALCRQIVGLRPGLATRLIVASGDAGTATLELARESMVCPVLAKPFELVELDRALTGLMA